MKNYFVEHVSSYQYDGHAALSLNDLCLVIQNSKTQAAKEQGFITEPGFDFVRDRVDFFGNKWKLFSFEKLHKRLTITSTSKVQVERNLGQFEQHKLDPEIFALPSPHILLNKDFANYMPELEGRGSCRPELMLEFTRRLHADFVYDPGTTTVETTSGDFFRSRRGVCQDFAHLAISILRSHGIKAAYVSGYLNTMPPPGTEKILGADASHAWISVYFEGQGWLDFDPTNGIEVGEGHIVVARGRDYSDVAPLKGVVLGGGAHSLEVRVTVIEQNEMKLNRS